MGERILISDAVEEFLLYLETIKGYSSNTVNSYRNDLEKFMSFCGSQKYADEYTFNDIRYAIPCMSELKSKSATINRFIASVRGLFAYCKKFGYINDNPALKLKTVKMDKPYHQVVTQKEMYSVCSSPENTGLLWPARDRALFEMLYSSGCRVSEMCSLTFKNFAPGYTRARITGKGNKDRIVFFEEDAVKALKLYLLEREEFLKQKFPGKKLQSIFVNRNGTVLTTRGVAWILSKYTSVEGINHHFSPHDFRHAFATALVNEGLDIRKVQALLGHASISTTQRYTHVTRKKIEEDYRKAHPHGGKNE
ncbi:tyrosine-type recombinase/integrase [Treponema sp.]|uniref:tyrosine-type recombinase/integrase n=1 Tax=Treponema sp. TaxID=166 RepID=UPI00298E6B34|nr:tyrosine-type recombinase/integrase [Treponema sp.]